MSTKEVYDIAMAGYRSAMIEEEKAFQQAQLSGDIQEQVRASQALAGYRASANEYHSMAVQHAQSAQAPRGNAYGLSDREVDIAKASLIQRPDMPFLKDEDKIRIYAENKQKLANRRAGGEYMTAEREKEESGG